MLRLGRKKRSSYEKSVINNQLSNKQDTFQHSNYAYIPPSWASEHASYRTIQHLVCNRNPTQSYRQRSPPHPPSHSSSSYDVKRSIMQSQYARRLIHAPDAEVNEQTDLAASVALTSSSIYEWRKMPLEVRDAARVRLVVWFALSGREFEIRILPYEGLFGAGWGSPGEDIRVAWYLGVSRGLRLVS